MNATRTKYFIPLSSNESSGIDTANEFVSELHGDCDSSVGKRGRPRGATTMVDVWIEQTAFDFQELYGLKLTTAIQHAVSSLIRFLKNEMAIENALEVSASQNKHSPEIRIMLDEAGSLLDETHLEMPKCAKKQRLERAKAGWKCLDEPDSKLFDTIVCTPLLGKPEVSKDHPFVRRNFKRLRRKAKN